MESQQTLKTAVGLPLLAVFAVLMMTGCVSSPEQDAPRTAANDEVSDIPWNRPQSWETGSSVPGMGGFTGTR